MYNLSMEQLVISPRNLRQQALADAKRQHILNAAKAVFMEFGLDAVSMREIAKQAGYTAGAIYSYFASKEDIYAALLTDSLERLNDCVSQSTQGASIDQKVDAKKTILELRKSAKFFTCYFRS